MADAQARRLLRARITGRLGVTALFSTLLLLVALLTGSWDFVQPLGFLTLLVSVPATLAYSAAAISPERFLFSPAPLSPELRALARYCRITMRRHALFTFGCTVLSALCCVFSLVHML